MTLSLYTCRHAKIPRNVPKYVECKANPQSEALGTWQDLFRTWYHLHLTGRTNPTDPLARTGPDTQTFLSTKSRNQS
jgi:hypothetical protein